MASSDHPPLLDENNTAFVQGGVSVVAASCDADGLPSIGRVTGCRVSSDRRRVSVFVAKAQALALLADVRAGRHIAVVFSRPTTHRTLQLKATDAELRPITAAEPALVSRYVDAFAAELVALGHDDDQARALCAGAQDELLAIDFTPGAAFEQTPGPRAGMPLAT